MKLRTGYLTAAIALMAAVLAACSSGGSSGTSAGGGGASSTSGATANLNMGGRGIGSYIESAFVNPLARALFQREHLQGQRIHVTSLSRTDGIYRIGLA